MTQSKPKKKRFFTRKRCLELLVGAVGGLLFCPIYDYAWRDGDMIKDIRAVHGRRQLRQELAQRQLTIPSEAEHGFSPDALVLLLDLGFTTSGVHRPMGSGFVVGDGSLVLTAAHCVTQRDEESRRIHTSVPFVVSPYYGDIFSAEVVAIDEEADIALLKPRWSGHPALQLGNEPDLIRVQELYAVTRSPSDRDYLDRSKDTDVLASPFSGQARMERLPVRTVTGLSRSRAIVLESTRFVTGGWSGSALLTTDNAHVIGILNSLYVRGKSGRRTIRRAQGASLRSIHALLEEHDCKAVASEPPADLPAIQDAPQAYAQVLRCCTHFNDEEMTQAFSAARELTELRNDSPLAHFLVGLCSYFLYAKDESDQAYMSLAEHSLEKALSLSDNQAVIHAVHANFLRLEKQPKRALAHVDSALAQDPNQELALYNRVTLLRHSDSAEAEKAARTLVDLQPEKARYWFNYGNILYSRGDLYDQALHAAQEAVRLDPQGKYGRLLAQTYEKLGRLDEAEANYLAMTEDCACQRCWFVYANFMAHHRSEDPNALAQADAAFEQADQEGKRVRVTEANMHKLRMKLDLKFVEQDKRHSLDLAEARVRRYLQTDPNEAYYWSALADVKRSQEQYAAAVTAARRSVTLAPDEDLRARLANVLAKAGELTESEQVYQEMLTRHPERAKYWYWFAKYLLDYSPDRLPEAQAALQKASDPNAPWPVDANDLAALRNKMAAATD
jgi:predicted Zn-dependent protease